MAAAAASTARRAHLAHIHRPWRIVFVLYTVAFIIATHWPHLAIGKPHGPPPDKVLHFFASAIFVVLLRMAGWIRSLLLVTVIGLIFVVTDEWTQARFAPGREWSPTDIAAGMAGTLCAALWLLSFVTPPWTKPHIRRHRLRLHYAWAIECTSRATWTRILITGVLAGTLATLAFYMLFIHGFATVNIVRGIRSAPSYIVAAGPGVGLMAAAACAAALVTRRSRKRLPDHDRARPCHMCGSGTTGTDWDEHGEGRCGACGSPLQITQWIGFAQRSAPWLPTSAHSIFLLIVLLPLYVTSYLVAAALFESVIAIVAGDRALPSALPVATVMLTAASTSVCVIWMLQRTWNHRRLTKPFVCPTCGYDLRHSPPTEDGTICSECGSAYDFHPRVNRPLPPAP